MTQPWFWRSLPLNERTGSDVFFALFHTNAVGEIATLLESPYPVPIDSPKTCARYSICAGAPRIVDGIPQMWTPPLGEVLAFLEQLPKKVPPHLPHPPFLLSPPPFLPFTGGWLGWLGYDVAWEIEKLPINKSDTLPFPVAFWYEPECFAVLDHEQQTLWLAASSITDLDQLENNLNQKIKEKSPSSHSPPPTPHPPLPTPHSFPTPHSPLIPHSPSFQTSQAEYEAAVRCAKKYIKAGDIFQANLSLRFETQTSASGWEIYRALQQINPSPFACYWKTPWGEVVSCSPERLVHLHENQAQTRPIAGTRKRGSTQEQDELLAFELLNNIKERAEHIMLVDLERNDLGRVCKWGTVKVDELLTIERYSHVMHLVSNVKGELKLDVSTVDLIRAMHPGGTITGCPKIRCMEIIEELEPVRRSLFYGSCGYLDWHGNLDLNIFIRTLLLAPFPHPKSPAPHSLLPTPHSRKSIVWGQVGAGIVADSDPEHEWYESLQKAQAQLKALGSI